MSFRRVRRGGIPSSALGTGALVHWGTLLPIPQISFNLDHWTTRPLDHTSWASAFVRSSSLAPAPNPWLLSNRDSCRAAARRFGVRERSSRLSGPAQNQEPRTKNQEPTTSRRWTPMHADSAAGRTRLLRCRIQRLPAIAGNLATPCRRRWGEVRGQQSGSIAAALQRASLWDYLLFPFL